MEGKHQFYKELSKTIKDGAGLQVSIDVIGDTELYYLGH